MFYFRTSLSVCIIHDLFKNYMYYVLYDTSN